MKKKKEEELIRVYRQKSDGVDKSDILIEVLGEPVVALKQMTAELWKANKSNTSDSDKSKNKT